MDDDKLREFARYIIQDLADEAELMDVIELYDVWHDEDNDVPEISERDADKVLTLIRDAVVSVYWPI